ncbi:MAG: flagellar hook-length control protein FliK [Alphaproteobacteria bacterium]
MTVALNTSLPTSVKTLPGLESEPGQDEPSSKMSFTELYWNEGESRKDKASATESPAEEPALTASQDSADPEDVIATKLTDLTPDQPAPVNGNFIGIAPPNLDATAPLTSENQETLSLAHLTETVGYNDVQSIETQATLVSRAADEDLAQTADAASRELSEKKEEMPPQTRAALPALQTPTDETSDIPPHGDAKLQNAKSPNRDYFAGTQIDTPKNNDGRAQRLDSQAFLPVDDSIKIPLNISPALSVDQLTPSLDTTTSLFSAVSAQSETLNRATPAQHVATTHLTTNGQPPAVQAVADNLIKAMVSQSGISIRLDPPEMGNVQISFQFDAERGVTAIVRSELADTSLFLKERADILQQTLKDSGFDSVTLSFEQGSQSNNEQSFTQGNYKEMNFAVDEAIALEPQKLQRQHPTSYSTIRNQPVDIKL